MRLLTSPSNPNQPRLSTRQVSAAAENIAAAQFSMYGFDVLEHGRQARHFYDLGVANAGGMLKVTVHGSLRGFWNLVDPYKTASNFSPAELHRVIDRWLDRQGARVTFCLVQFEHADLKMMPRLYLATAAEIAARLHESVDTLGDTALYEEYEIADGSGRHSVERLPARWHFSQERIAELMESPDALPLEYRLSASASPAVTTSMVN